MKFSERIGKTPVKLELERESISRPLRNQLWNIVHDKYLKFLRNSKSLGELGYTKKATFFRKLWIEFFKNPVDELPIHYIHKSIDERFEIGTFRPWFFKAQWYELLDLLEFIFQEDQKFQMLCNDTLRSEKSSYRFIDGSIVEMKSEEEVIELQEVILNTTPYQTVQSHLQKAIALYGDRKEPDFTNSIKESILAVESLAQIITSESKGTLGKLLKRMDDKQPIPKALQAAFSSLYGFSSDEGGIRHAMKPGGAQIGMDEARFMLVACSAFVNYVISKHAQKD